MLLKVQSLSLLPALLVLLTQCMGAPTLATNDLNTRQLSGGPDESSGQIIIGLKHSLSTPAGQQDYNCLLVGFHNNNIYGNFITTVPPMYGVVYGGIEGWSHIISTFQCVKFVTPNRIIGSA
ncbi:hypothetical protein H4R33_002467 [Dimargaris cristalligena]|uniref:Jacalin-type lectin domain-containing protein n=1 Tax=Dimargaris cristalligena TaxID=215637 RepID=A0A4V1J4W4_9FUNG|nr:hypothetical protein H4R33_002467 [Dimargaris cristalligena]RKP36969.1 hypothetical protein BJ085DRAFT_34284 [Dimargaris cristalligena]|eukprot:RKP36969.1 hypothetical protein BJ085DRAFT_34284 [Dimargaris cristalligena]